MTNFKIGALSVDPVAYGSQGNAILGIRDSGKTYTATFIAEKLFEAGIPFIAFDPIGVWRYLRIPGKGRGYPVVVAGGQEGDLPLTVASAPEIAPRKRFSRKVMAKKRLCNCAVSNPAQYGRRFRLGRPDRPPKATETTSRRFLF